MQALRCWNVGLNNILLSYSQSERNHSFLNWLQSDNAMNDKNQRPVRLRRNRLAPVQYKLVVSPVGASVGAGGGTGAGVGAEQDPDSKVGHAVNRKRVERRGKNPKDNVNGLDCTCLCFKRFATRLIFIWDRYGRL